MPAFRARALSVLVFTALAGTIPALAQDKAVALPVFHHKGVVLDYKDLKYNPCDDIIIPSVVRTDHLQKPLGRYYMFTNIGPPAPEDRPGCGGRGFPAVASARPYLPSWSASGDVLLFRPNWMTSFSEL